MSSRIAGQKRAKYDADDAPSSSLSTLEDQLLNNNVWRDTLLPYLDHDDLICLMHVSKATRRIAAPLLNKIETKSNQTICHTEMFRSFLRSPRVTKANKVWEELTTDHARSQIAGPLRLYHIKEHAAEIEKRFAILKYTKSYDMECSVVIVFNEKGEYISQYTFASEMFYEDYATKNIMQGGDHLGRRVFNRAGGSNTSMPRMTLLSTDVGWNSRDSPENRKWRRPGHVQTEYAWQEGWMGCFVGKLRLVHIMCLKKLWLF